LDCVKASTTGRHRTGKGRPLDEAAASLTLQAGREELDLSSEQLWIHCFALGADFTEQRLEGFLVDKPHPGRHDHNLIAQALNDRFIDRGQDHLVAYED
jgi:hypothetical protein